MSLPPLNHHTHAPPPHVAYAHPYPPHPVTSVLQGGHPVGHPPLPHMQQMHPQPVPSAPPPPGTVAPADTTYLQATTAANGSPLVAQGDWTKNLVHLAKTAELKKHALTLQLHTAHILSAHATLDSKNKALQDIKEQKNRLESERTRLLNCLREVNEDRDKADLMETSINKECNELRTKIQSISDGEYATAKREVDALRAELGQPPLPSLQQTLEEKSSAYLNERLRNGDSTPVKRTNETAFVATPDTTPGKRPRGRPKGSKNKVKTPTTPAAGTSTAGGTGAAAASAPTGSS